MAKSEKTGITLTGISEVQKNLSVTVDYITNTTLNAVGMIGFLILQSALPHTPYDTGELRRSGTAMVMVKGRPSYNIVVGRGTRSGVAKKYLHKLNRQLSKNVRSIYANVSFDREGENIFRNAKGELVHEPIDVAVFTHEHLLPYEARPNVPAATKPGTGPKYLETAFVKLSPLLEKTLRRIIKSKIPLDLLQSQIVVQRRHAAAKYKADRIKLRKDKLLKKSKNIPSIKV